MEGCEGNDDGGSSGISNKEGRKKVRAIRGGEVRVG